MLSQLYQLSLMPRERCGLLPRFLPHLSLIACDHREGVRVLLNGDGVRSLERYAWRWKMKMLKNEDAFATLGTACVCPLDFIFGWMLGDRLSNRLLGLPRILMEGK